MRNFLRMFLNLIPDQTIVPILRGPLKGKKWIKGSGVNGYWIGSYEPAKQKALASVVKLDQVVYDIGAHAGFYALLASSLVGRNGIVYALEPLPGNLNFLIRHIELNHCANVKVISGAALDKNELIYFNQGVNTFSGFIDENPSILMAQAFTLDSLVKKNNIPIPHVIKIDVEGRELEVLRGSAYVLQNFHPIIFLATHSPESHRSCSDLLQAISYKLEKIGDDDGEVLATHTPANN